MTTWPFSVTADEDEELLLVPVFTLFCGRDTRFLPMAALFCHFLAILMSFLVLIIIDFVDIQKDRSEGY